MVIPLEHIRPVQLGDMPVCRLQPVWKILRAWRCRHSDAAGSFLSDCPSLYSGRLTSLSCQETHNAKLPLVLLLGSRFDAPNAVMWLRTVSRLRQHAYSCRLIGVRCVRLLYFHQFMQSTENFNPHEQKIYPCRHFEFV